MNRQPNESITVAHELRRRYENARRLDHPGEGAFTVTLDEFGAFLETTDEAIALLCTARMEDYIQTALRAFK